MLDEESASQETEQFSKENSVQKIRFGKKAIHGLSDKDFHMMVKILGKFGVEVEIDETILGNEVYVETDKGRYIFDRLNPSSRKIIRKDEE